MILQSPPHGDEKVWNALRLAKALTTVAIGMKVNIFLLGDAVTTAKKGAKTSRRLLQLRKNAKGTS